MSDKGQTEAEFDCLVRAAEDLLDQQICTWPDHLDTEEKRKAWVAERANHYLAQKVN